MADYKAWTASNNFKVKDLDKFKEWAKGLSLTVYEDNLKNTVSFTAENSGDGSIPSDRENLETEDIEDFDFDAELSTHLLDGEIAVYTEVGHMKLNDLVGYSVAVSSTGDVLLLTLDEICHKVKKYWHRDVERL